MAVASFGTKPSFGVNEWRNGVRWIGVRRSFPRTWYAEEAVNASKTADQQSPLKNLVDKHSALTAQSSLAHSLGAFGWRRKYREGAFAGLVRKWNVSQEIVHRSGHERGHLVFLSLLYVHRREVRGIPPCAREPDPAGIRSDTNPAERVVLRAPREIPAIIHEPQHRVKKPCQGLLPLPGQRPALRRPIEPRKPKPKPELCPGLGLREDVAFGPGSQVILGLS